MTSRDHIADSDSLVTGRVTPYAGLCCISRCSRTAQIGWEAGTLRHNWDPLPEAENGSPEHERTWKTTPRIISIPRDTSRANSGSGKYQGNPRL